ncbi:SRPBCC family protein [Gulosibacter molinativorax]|uniref:SRPBCC domain-containing protein n=1 Tax=Gulosibacter molinativorax TaxID=256821 RepID=A0ABT7C9I5_9MICO|nr:SRPBCC domain-containing protein [Gulosibacter molinativorax]MDJ1371444.1 SRPBCC domain-containing protein [Gulosibacter molinativorax]QUY62942.1 Activator of HSP90 ATPase [Gulosibacter molinativorax]
MNATPEFTITRTVNASRDLVWRAWTEHEHLQHWLHPFGVTTESISFDVRVGGEYRYTMINEETGEQFPTGGVFLEVERPERLKFTWGTPGDADAPVVTVSLVEVDDGTQLTFHLVGIEGKPGDGFVYDGWDEALQNFAAHVTRVAAK